MKYTFLLVMLCIFQCTKAQQFGGFPPSVKWKQINTDTARIIFSDFTLAEAQKIASIIHTMAARQPVSPGNELNKIDIVLHNNTTLANGYVALAPYRSEFYLIPGTNLFEFGNTPWHEQLAIHEYRHVQQYNNMNKGFTKAFSAVLGEEGRALANGISIPNWFFEGDAVYAETALTPQGRGRAPFFLSGYTSLWKDAKNYSLMKRLNGSLKDYVPNHYQFGYLVVNYGYLKYGNDFWRKVINDAASFKGIFYPFQKAIKKYTGLTYKAFIKEAFAYYRKEVSVKEDMQQKNVVSNYYFPQWINEDSIIYLKSTFHSLPHFYIETEKEETKIKLKNIGSEEWFSYHNGIIAYSAYATDARWQLNNYSNILLLNVHTGKEKWLTKKSKYFTPDFSPSGKTIVAIQVIENGNTEIHVLDAASGKVKKSIPAPTGVYAYHPKFINEDNIVVFYREMDGSVKINRMNLKEGKLDLIMDAHYSTVGYPSVQHDTLYFSASFDANDNIYAFSLSTKNLIQITTGQTGKYYPSALKNKLAYTDFTAHGLQLKIDTLTKKTIQNTDTNLIASPSYLFAVANDTAHLLHPDNRNFEVTEYKTSYNLFNFHSWRPYYSDPQFTFSLFGQNILNTFNSQLFYRYNRAEKSNGGGFNIAYGGLFPIISTGLEYTYNRHINTTNRQYNVNELEWRTGINFPLNFTKGKTYKLLNFGTDYVLNRQEQKNKLIAEKQHINTDYLRHFISITQQLPRATQHIFPKLGYGFSMEQRHRLMAKGFQYNGNARLYLPGLLKNNSIVLTGSYQLRDTGSIAFSNRFSNARGYHDYNLSKMWRASANYHFPIAYPDWGFGQAIYFLRVRPNLFFDYSKVYSKNKKTTRNQHSTGAELFFDTKVLNQLPVTFGFRYSRLLNDQLLGKTNRNVWEIIVPVNLIP